MSALNLDPATGKPLDHTYGSHQEAAAGALNQLLGHVPEPHAVEQFLDCRIAAVDALNARMFHLGVDSHHRYATTEASKVINLASVPRDPATLLVSVGEALPRPIPNPEEVRSPLDALTTPSTDPATEHMRTAAAELLAGTHTLETATEQPWLTDHGAAWHLIGDTAVALEAITLIDRDLDKAGLLTDHHTTAPGWNLENQRLITSQTARAATWYATTNSPDLATSPTTGQPARQGPVRTVNQPGDLLAAQRQLAGYLNPRGHNDSFASTEKTMDATTARAIATNQRAFCENIARLCEDQPHLTAIGEEFIRRRDLYIDVEKQVKHLTDVEPTRPNPAALGQQREINQAMKRFGDSPPLHPVQIHDLANVSHDVMHHLATATRREAFRDASNLRRADPLNIDPPAQLWRRGALGQALSAAIDTPPPSVPVHRVARPVQREALRATIDTTPTRPRLNPYPRWTGNPDKGHGR